jgi:hypothetical protein
MPTFVAQISPSVPVVTLETELSLEGKLVTLPLVVMRPSGRSVSLPVCIVDRPDAVGGDWVGGPLSRSFSNVDSSLKRQARRLLSQTGQRAAIVGKSWWSGTNPRWS